MSTAFTYELPCDWLCYKKLAFGSNLVYVDGASITREEARNLLYVGGMMFGRNDENGDEYVNQNPRMKRIHVAKVLKGSLKYMVNK